MRKLVAIAALTFAACSSGGGGGTGATTVASPTFSPAAGTYHAVQDVTIACATAGAAIHYTTDGSTPTVASPTHGSAIHVTNTTTIKAMATATGQTDSAVVSATYTLQAATPVISPAAGTYATTQSVTITSATPAATIHYTTDGSTPTSASPAYTAAISLPLGATAATTTVKAVATATGFADSAVASSTFVIDASVTPAATPTFSPGPGTYASAQSVTISSTTPSAAIYYTSDGSTPTAASAPYGGPVLVDASKTLKAIATATGHATSAVGSATYVIGTGGGSDFLTVCGALFDKQASLLTTCLHANPDYTAALVGPMQAFCPDIQKEITAGLVTFDATQGTACATAIQALTCDGLAAGMGQVAPASCTASLIGTVGTGGACYSSTDCAGGFCTWELASGTCPGTCQPFAALGADCTSKLCADGQTCSSSGGTSICKADSAVGGACPCQADLWCDTSGGGAGLCKAPLALGATCTKGSDECGFLAKCEGTPATCQAYVGLGASCTPGSSPLDSLCGFGYSCDSGTSKCVSWPKVGETCSMILPICIGGYCDLLAASPTCKTYLADGATCNPIYSGMDCASGSCSASSKCESGRCALP